MHSLFGVQEIANSKQAIHYNRSKRGRLAFGVHEEYIRLDERFENACTLIPYDDPELLASKAERLLDMASRGRVGPVVGRTCNCGAKVMREYANGKVQLAL